MKRSLSDGEKKELLRYHGQVLAKAFTGLTSTYRDDLIEHAEKAIELIKSIPKIEFSIR